MVSLRILFSYINISSPLCQVTGEDKSWLLGYSNLKCFLHDSKIHKMDHFQFVHFQRPSLIGIKWHFDLSQSTFLLRSTEEKWMSKIHTWLFLWQYWKSKELYQCLIVTVLLLANYQDIQNCLPRKEVGK